MRATGSEFTPGAEVFISYGVGDPDVMTELARVTADENGGIDVIITLPAHLPLNSNAELEAIGQDMEGGERLLLELIALEEPAQDDDCDEGDDDEDDDDDE